MLPRRYATFQAVVDDLVLVFDNAIAFNADAATGVNGPKDDLAAKMVDIASHMKHVIHHWALEFFKDEDGANASSAATRDTAATRNGVCRDDYAVVLDAAELEREATRRAQAEAAKALEAEARPLDKDAVDAALAGDAAAPAPAPPPEKPKGKSIEKPKLPPRAQARFDARRARDAAVWPSTLKYNPKGIGEARQVTPAASVFFFPGERGVFFPESGSCARLRRAADAARSCRERVACARLPRESPRDARPARSSAACGSST